MDRNISTETTLDSRPIKENKNTMQELADIKTYESQIAKMKADPQANKTELSKLEYLLKRLKEKYAGRDPSKDTLVKQCNDYFEVNKKLLNKNQIIAETKARLANGEMVNEWPHLAAVFLLEAQAITQTATVGLDALRTQIEADKKFFSEMKSYTLDGKTLTFKEFNYDSWRSRYLLTLSNDQTFYLQKNPDKSWSAVSPTSENYNVTIDATNKTVTIKNKVENRENSVERLIKETQARLDAYAKENGIEKIKLEGTGDFAKWPDTSQVQEYQVTVHRKININWTISDSKPVVYSGISLQKGHLGPIKTTDELSSEIIRMIWWRPVPPREESAPNRPPATTERPTHRPRANGWSREGVETNPEDYNKKFYAANKERFDTVFRKLDKEKDGQWELQNILALYAENQTPEIGEQMQELLNNKFKKNLKIDKRVGPETLSALESIVGIQSPRSWWGSRRQESWGSWVYTPTPEERERQELARRGRLSVETAPFTASSVSFSRDGGRVLLNARDPSGTVVQKLSYPDILALARKAWERGKEMPENMKTELSQLTLISTIADLWIQTASKQMNSLLAGSFRTEAKATYERKINEMTAFVQVMQSEFQSGKDISGQIGRTKAKFQTLNDKVWVFNMENLWNTTNLNSALDIALGTKSGTLEQDRAKMLKGLSTVFDAGLTEWVQTTAMAEVAKMSQFSDLRTKLADPAFMVEFTSGNSKKWLPLLQSAFGLTEKETYSLARDLRDIRQWMSAKEETIRSTLSSQWVPADKIDDQLKWAKSTALQMAMSKYVIDAKIDSLPKWWYIDAYKTATNDLTTNKIIDIATQMAISLVPMGAGLLAVRWAAAVWRRVLPRLAQSTGWKAGATRMVGEWALFYETYNLTNNLIRNQDTNSKLFSMDYLEWWDDSKEILKNIAMLWIISKLGINPGPRINLLKDKPKLQAFTQETLKALGIGGVVVGTSFTIDWIAWAIDPASSFEEGWNPSWEEYAQAVVMTALFRKYGNIRKWRPAPKWEAPRLPNGSPSPQRPAEGNPQGGNNAPNQGPAAPNNPNQWPAAKENGARGKKGQDIQDVNLVKGSDGTWRTAEAEATRVAKWNAAPSPTWVNTPTTPSQWPANAPAAPKPTASIDPAVVPKPNAAPAANPNGVSATNPVAPTSTNVAPKVPADSVNTPTQSPARIEQPKLEIRQKNQVEVTPKTGPVAEVPIKGIPEGYRVLQEPNRKTRIVDRTGRERAKWNTLDEALWDLKKSTERSADDIVSELWKIKGKGNKAQQLRDALNTNKLWGEPTIHDLRMSRENVNNINTGRDKTFAQTKDDLIAYLDDQIARREGKAANDSSWGRVTKASLITGGAVSVGTVAAVGIPSNVGDQPTPGADQPTPGADQPTPGADQPTPGADQPTPGADQPTPGA
jgi:hypothetical protein